MKRRQIHIAELSAPQSISDTNHINDFIEILQTAVLLSLLERGQLSKRQFDLCLETLKGEQGV